MTGNPLMTDGWRSAQDLFYVNFNEINFFVEDENMENLYFYILKKFLPGIKIEKIFPLGGKEAVIKHLELNSESHRAAYIVDKDWDDLLGEKVAHPNLFYLEKHSIENYFLNEEQAYIALIAADLPKTRSDKIANIISFSTVLTETLFELNELNKMLYASQRVEFTLQKEAPPTSLGIITTGKGIGIYLNSNSDLCPSRIEAKKNEIASAIKARGIPIETLDYFTPDESVIDVSKNSIEQALRHVHGHFALEFFCRKLWAKLNLRCPHKTNSLMIHLAQRSELNEFTSFSKIILAKFTTNYSCPVKA